MTDTNQTTLTLATAEQVRQAWAFAKATNSRATRARRRHRKAVADVSQAVITACSRQARQFGVHVGMTYADAKRQVPELRILVIGA